MMNMGRKHIDISLQRKSNASSSTPVDIVNFSKTQIYIESSSPYTINGALFQTLIDTKHNSIFTEMLFQTQNLQCNTDI